MNHDLLTRPQFSVPPDEKNAVLCRELQALTEDHRARCEPYARVLSAMPAPVGEGLAAVPFLPISLFKTHRLLSVPPEEVFKTLTSSGTTGQAVSHIFLDRQNATRQSLALARIMERILGSTRRPMVIVDSAGLIRDRRQFSARAAGIVGMLPFGRDHFYCLDDEMNLDVEGLLRFADAHAGEEILVFGFTFMVWRHLVQALARAGRDVDLSGATLIHAGGWKKLQSESVSKAEFRRTTRDILGLGDIHDFYGMVEQIGSTYLEADDGYLRPPNFADVIVRDPVSWAPSPPGEVGVVQLLSLLPTSYPGHSILTEDLGVAHGVDDGSDGWAGTRLEIVGRIPKAELRGCSDTHAAAWDLHAERKTRA